MSVKVELTVDEAEWMASLNTGTGSAALRVVEKCAAALAKHEREEKRKALGLPWRSLYADASRSLNLWRVDSVHLEDESFTQLSLALNESQARLMAAAPDLAKALEEIVYYVKGGYPDGDAGAELRNAGAALKKAGW